MSAAGARGFVIRFQDASMAEAGVFAADLRETILDAHPDVSAERQRLDSTAQDFGTSLAVVIGTPAILAVAKGIQTWLKRHHAAKIRIERPNGTIVAENLTGSQVLDLTKLLSSGQDTSD